MMKSQSPLRYPGGKTILAPYLSDLIRENDIKNCVYVEPFAGGAGAAISLLLSGRAQRIILNDADRSIYCFWKCVKTRTQELIDKINATDITVENWFVQKQIYKSKKSNELDLAFAALYLNRCNRSGIVANGGIIGGKLQAGKWKINARFNKIDIIKRLNKIAAHADSIEVHNLDALEFVKKICSRKAEVRKLLIYLDPPYYMKGSRLYLNYYNPEDHGVLSAYLKKIKEVKWLASYDNVPEIRDLYLWCNSCEFTLGYSAYKAKVGCEVMFFGKELKNVLPETLVRSG